MKRIGVVLILLLAFLGIADSAYLAQHEIDGTPLICDIQNLSGCNVVANSQYSHLFGIPLAEYGVLFYGVLFVLAALELVLFDRLLRRVLQVTSLFGVLASLYFMGLQIFFIGAFCIYCIASAIITVLVLALASRIEPFRTKKLNAPIPPTLPPSPYISIPPEA